MKGRTYFKVLILFVFITAGISFGQQPDTTAGHKFLWFHGHWDKKQKNTFLINSSYGGGGTVIIESDRDVRLNTNDEDEWNNNIDVGINELQKWEDEFTASSVDRQEYAHHFNERLISILDNLKNNWKSNKINPKDNLVSLKLKQWQGFKNHLFNWCATNKPVYESIMDFYKKHRHDKNADLQNPPPPEFSYDCAGCDTSIQNRQDTIVAHYVIKFSNPELKLLHEALRIVHDLGEAGYVDDILKGPRSITTDNEQGRILDQAFRRSKDPSKTGPCAYIDFYDLNDAIVFLAIRLKSRAEKLLRDYENDYAATKAVLKTYLSVMRLNSLLGLSTNVKYGDLAYMSHELYDHYFDELVKKHDWTQLSNIFFLIKLERQCQLLGSNEFPAKEGFQKLLEVLNSFQLKIEMDIKVGRQGGYIITRLKGKSKIAPEFEPDSEQCYTWVAALDKPDRIGNPVKQGAGVIHMDLLDNEMVAPGPHPVYIGTKKYYTELKLLKMDFCHPGQDTILFTKFISDPPAGGMWKVPYSPNQAYNIWNTDSFFKDDNKIIQLAKSGAFEQQAQVMKQKGLQLKAQMEAMESKMKNSNSMPDIHKLQEIVNQVQGLGNNKNLSPVFYIDFPLQIHNGTKTIFHKRFDSKQVNPLAAEAVIYGYMTIDISYTGN